MKTCLRFIFIFSDFPLTFVACSVKELKDKSLYSRQKNRISDYGLLHGTPWFISKKKDRDHCQI